MEGLGLLSTEYSLQSTDVRTNFNMQVLCKSVSHTDGILTAMFLLQVFHVVSHCPEWLV